MHIHSITMQPNPAMLETTQCLCLAARRAARAITREFDHALRRHGLRATQFTLLAALQIGGDRSIGELAELLSADRTTLTRNLAVAGQHGFVTLQRDPGDARSRIATITGKGMLALTAALPAWRRTQRKLLEEIGDETAVGLRRLAGGPCAATLPPSRRRRVPRSRLSKSRSAVRQQAGHPRALEKKA